MFKLKKIKKPLFVTLLVFSAASLSTYPSTNSRYITNETDWLTYKVGINKMYMGEKIVVGYDATKTNYEKIVLTFNFDRSNNMLDTDTKNKYKIEVESGCTITNVKTKGSKSINNNKATITYSTKSTDKIEVTYECSVDSLIKSENSIDYIVTYPEVKEAFNNENIYYSYLKGKLKPALTLEAFRLKYPLPKAEISEDKKSIIIPDNLDDKFTEITKWIDLYSQKYAASYLESETYLKDVSDYYKLVYNDSNYDTVGLLEGFNVDKSVTGQVTYSIDDNFLGYVKTELYKSGGLLYFSNTSLDATTADQVFKYYLNKYYYEKDTTEYNTIINYIKRKGGIITALSGSTINGITYYPEKKAIKINNILDVATPILSYNYSFTYDASTNNGRAANTLLNTLKGTTFVDDLGNEYSIDDKIYQGLFTADTFSKLSSKNTMFDEYIEPITSLDGTVTLLARIYSNGVDTTGIDAYLIKNNTTYNLPFNSSYIVGSDFTRITNVLDYIDNDIKDGLTLVILNDGGTYTTSGGVIVTVTNTSGNINISFTK